MGTRNAGEACRTLFVAVSKWDLFEVPLLLIFVGWRFQARPWLEIFVYHIIQRCSINQSTAHEKHIYFWAGKTAIRCKSIVAPSAKLGSELVKFISVFCPCWLRKQSRVSSVLASIHVSSWECFFSQVVILPDPRFWLSLPCRVN